MAEARLAIGDLAGARERIPPSKALPSYHPADTLAIAIWAAMVGRLGHGSQLEVLRWRCARAGLRSDAEIEEMWERVGIVEEEAQRHMALMAKTG